MMNKHDLLGNKHSTLLKYQKKTRHISTQTMN